ncbi:TetR/AcrR family transcriptional regulator [Actinomadura kijaniata]|uniref:TetR/AcrR family transcriptional regulator n=1 Tax=Actinomadura kijaniata TaxID=46161 RepID=UPI000830E009|nr:TetR/AcrR family transcriptional regulator [Actinomadura kijaniata]
MTNPGQRVGRPREGRVDEAILTATRELLAETGYAGLTVDGVAARAGIGKAAIYRRHASKQEMVFAAAIEGPEPEPPPDTGSLRGDLGALTRMVAASLGGPVASGVALRLLADMLGTPALIERAARVFVAPQRAALAELFRRAVRRGELERVPDVELLHAVVSGTSFLWLHIARHDPDELPERLAHAIHAALLTEDGPA